MNDLMIDLETLGLEANAVILSISAVEFNLNTGEIGREFSKNINVESCLNVEMMIEANTLSWWLKQDYEAKEVFFGESEELKEVILQLKEFIDQKDYFVWGNSNRFDLNILENAFKKVEIDTFWDFRKERDVRTLVSFAPEIKKNCVFKGIKHNSLDDCKHQIRYCCETYNKLNK